MPTDESDARMRALLTDRLERTQAQASALDVELNALVSARRSESNDDEHDPEGEPLSLQWSMRAGLLESARAEVRHIQDAMERLDAGSYGVCTACRAPIPLPQLEARPFRERCVPCAR